MDRKRGRPKLSDEQRKERRRIYDEKHYIEKYKTKDSKILELTAQIEKMKRDTVVYDEDNESLRGQLLEIQGKFQLLKEQNDRLFMLLNK